MLKLFHREISFEDIDAEGIITRAWELSKRILIYCLYVNILVEFSVPMHMKISVIIDHN